MSASQSITSSEVYSSLDDFSDCFEPSSKDASSSDDTSSNEDIESEPSSQTPDRGCNKKRKYDCTNTDDGNEDSLGEGLISQGLAKQRRLINTLAEQLAESRRAIVDIEQERDQALKERVTAEESCLAEAKQRIQVMLERDTARGVVENLKFGERLRLAAGNFKFHRLDEVTHERVEAITLKREAMQERDEAIRERHEAIQEKDVAVQERDDAFAMRDDAMDMLRRTTAVMNRATAERDRAIRESQMTDKRNEAVERRLAAVTEELQLIRSNHSALEARLKLYLNCTAVIKDTIEYTSNAAASESWDTWP